MVDEEPTTVETPTDVQSPQAKDPSRVVYIYRLDESSKLPIIVGKVFIDQEGDAWVRINATDLAAGIGVEDIDGVALLDRDTFNGQDQ